MVPPLPQIQGDVDIVLDLYTHVSLRFGIPPLNEDYGDMDRLAELGRSVLEMAVTYHLFLKKPYYACQELTASRNAILSDETINEWLEQYQIKHKIRYNPKEVDALTLEDYRKFFHCYIGALYFRNGISTVQDWISKLIDPDINMDPYPGTPTPIPPTSAPPHLPPAPPPPHATNPLITLAHVNQTAAQKGYLITYSAEQFGPSHQPTWTVSCKINGVEKGVGKGKNQKQGKEEAARQAYASMGW